MFENLSIGLDIATALSVIAAATAFIWNSIVSKKNELNERKKEIFKKEVFKYSDKIIVEANAIYNEVIKIQSKINDGDTIQDLNHWKRMIEHLPTYFRWLAPLDEVYGNGKFKNFESDYKNELADFINYFAALVDPESDEEWDFYTVMDIPTKITIKYITKLYQEMEDYFETI